MSIVKYHESHYVTVLDMTLYVFSDCFSVTVQLVVAAQRVALDISFPVDHFLAPLTLIIILRHMGPISRKP